jgi:hypothetical protein
MTISDLRVEMAKFCRGATAAQAACSCPESARIGTPGSDFDTRIDSADLTCVTLGAAVSLLVRNRS